jgi:hypothetical protein
MKIRMTINGPVVGSDVTEVVDIQEYFSIDPSETGVEESIDECVADWAGNYYSYGWEDVDEDTEVDV